jgi:ribosome biogenesis protein BRX1
MALVLSFMFITVSSPVPLHYPDGALWLQMSKRARDPPLRVNAYRETYRGRENLTNNPAVHTMSELNFTGNALKGSRAIVSFDKNFDLQPSSALIKELLLHTFSVPKGARKSKPFIDRVVNFTLADGKVWVRHFQIQVSAVKEKKDDDEKAKDKETTELVEIGPRFVLTPILILEGSFGGPKVYENREFVSPNAVRREIRDRKAVRASGRDGQRIKRSVKKKEVAREQAVAKQMEREIDDAMLFA